MKQLLKSRTSFKIIYLVGWFLNSVFLGILLRNSFLEKPFVVGFGLTFFLGGLRFLLEGVTKHRGRFGQILHSPLSWYFYATLALIYFVYQIIDGLISLLPS